MSYVQRSNRFFNEEVYPCLFRFALYPLTGFRQDDSDAQYCFSISIAACLLPITAPLTLFTIGISAALGFVAGVIQVIAYGMCSLLDCMLDTTPSSSTINTIISSERMSHLEEKFSIPPLPNVEGISNAKFSLGV